MARPRSRSDGAPSRSIRLVLSTRRCFSLNLVRTANMPAAMKSGSLCIMHDTHETLTAM
jgi:hypothetical protein